MHICSYKQLYTNLSFFFFFESLEKNLHTLILFSQHRIKWDKSGTRQVVIEGREMKGPYMILTLRDRWTIKHTGILNENRSLSFCLQGQTLKFQSSLKRYKGKMIVSGTFVHCFTSGVIGYKNFLMLLVSVAQLIITCIGTSY